MSGVPRPRLLLVMCGEASPDVVAVGGNYDQWFRRAFGELAELERHDVYSDGAPALGPLDAYDGVVVSGSTSSVCEQRPWMQRLAGDLREAAQAGRAILGVCFGHQLLGEAFGGRVAEHGHGREIGTIEVALTAAGQASPLFAGISPRAQFNATHGDHLVELPGGVTRLAENPHSAEQAFQVGPRTFGVQFHPEIDAPTMQAMIRKREPELVAQALARGHDEATARRRVAELHESVDEAPAGRALLANFVRRVVG